MKYPFSIVLVSVLFSLLPLNAQEGVNLQERGSLLRATGRTVKSISDWGIVHFFSDYDSTYFDFPAKKWSIKFTTNVTGSEIRVKSRGSDPSTAFHSNISSESNMTHSLTLGYRSFAVSYTFDPYSKRGNKDSRWSFTTYGNPICLDIVYYKINSFSGYSVLDRGERVSIPFGGPSMKYFNANAFYVFNHKHYSFPASVDQTYIQYKSTGSAIAGITYTNNRTSIPDLGVEAKSLSINAKMLALGAGYGYTWVPGSRWHLMLLAMPKLVFYDSSSLEEGRYRISRTFTRPQFMFTGHAAVVHWFNGWFAALTANVEGYRVGNISGLRLVQMQWQARLHFGILF